MSKDPRSNKDPVKHCDLYKDEGCAHVDGFLCEYGTCKERIQYMENMNMDELLDKFSDLQKKVIRLKELNAPKVIIDFDEATLNETITELSKYVNMKDLDKLLKNREEARKQEYRQWRKEVGEELRSKK